MSNAQATSMPIVFVTTAELEHANKNIKNG